MRTLILLMLFAGGLVVGCDSGDALTTPETTNAANDTSNTSTASDQTQPDETQTANNSAAGDDENEDNDAGDDDADEGDAHQPVDPNAVDPNPVEPGQPEPPAGVSFSKSVMPILAANCNEAKCHGNVNPAKGIALTSYAGVMKQVRAGNATNSALYRSITGARPKMPENRPALSSADVQTVKDWIGQGALDN
jgi:hypothetical protein